jgi:predicted secreted protein
MNWFTGTMVFILIWWLTWFCALPIGVHRPDNPESGHEPGAPEKPYLWWKLFGTTLVAVVIFAGVFWLISSDYLSFRDLIRNED